MKIVLSVLMLLLAAAPASALTSEEATDIVEWATGDEVAVEVDRTWDAPNGYFTLYGGFPHIVVMQPEWMPDEWAVIILLHEAAHYIQWRDGYIDSMESVDREWQADVWGTRAACARGVKSMAFHDLWAWMLEHYGDDDSQSHGRKSARMVNGMLRVKDVCGNPVIQTPWA